MITLELCLFQVHVFRVGTEALPAGRAGENHPDNACPVGFDITVVAGYRTIMPVHRANGAQAEYISGFRVFKVDLALRQHFTDPGFIFCFFHIRSPYRQSRYYLH